LHRSAADPVGNSEVISSLLSDSDRYVMQSPPVKKPDIVVVSGDVIQGVGLGEQDYENIIREQYRQADQLLGEIADRFLDGDRRRIAICAGNHDICWNTALSAMTEVNDDAEVSKLRHHDFFDPNSQYRWDWRGKRAYKINDRELYDSRLNKYWDFLEGFFGNYILDLET
jgi:Calcineurin-like phosphoesterase